ncbi:hypothetical protein [Streptomyces chrestomyceticus]|uniref:hypothetical protein n=1 Tax=Streptomyces chrestomyceticus TaxID=68185 RepID=UPI0033CFBBB4
MAGAFASVEFEQFQQARAFGGDSDQVHWSAWGGEHHGGVADLQQVHAVLDAAVEVVGGVEVGDEGVGQVDEGGGDPYLARRPGDGRRAGVR